MKVLVLNGPNINLLGKRDQRLYGSLSYPQLKDRIASYSASKGVRVDIKQSNHEGVLIDLIQEADEVYDAIIINAAGYTHTSISIMDAIQAVSVPCVEVHLSDISKRESFRKISYLKPVCIASFVGEQVDSYLKALDYIIEKRHQ
jgi:3-dehydroquinate dehydratase-2